MYTAHASFNLTEHGRAIRREAEMNKRKKKVLTSFILAFYDHDDDDDDDDSFSDRFDFLYGRAHVN